MLDVNVRSQHFFLFPAYFRWWAQALRLKPDFPEVVFRMARLQKAQGHWSSAIKVIKECTDYMVLKSTHDSDEANAGHRLPLVVLECRSGRWTDGLLRDGQVLDDLFGVDTRGESVSYRAGRAGCEGLITFEMSRPTPDG